MNEQDGFLKRHGFLIAGVALPLLVVVVFVLARTLPRWWVEDPRYDVVYGTRSDFILRTGPIEGEVTVVDGRLRVAWTYIEYPVVLGRLRLHRLNPATGVVGEIRVPDPEYLSGADGTVALFVPGLEGFRVETNRRSPDGYEFEGAQGGSGGLLGEILVDHNRRARNVIRKGGRVIVLPDSNDGSYGFTPMEFLGWLVPVEAAR